MPLNLYQWQTYIYISIIYILSDIYISHIYNIYIFIIYNIYIYIYIYIYTIYIYIYIYIGKGGKADFKKDTKDSLKDRLEAFCNLFSLSNLIPSGTYALKNSESTNKLILLINYLFFLK